jgi:hypothetical protein
MGNCVMKYSERPANKTKGILMRSTDGSYFFRVYGVDHSFKDYELLHNDLQVVIDDDSSFYEGEDNGDGQLDHTSQTLGRSES